MLEPFSEPEPFPETESFRGAPDPLSWVVAAPPEEPPDEELPAGEASEDGEGAGVPVLDLGSLPAVELEADSDCVAFLRASEGYSVTYQPPPLRMKEVAESNRWIGPPQRSQVWSAGSEMRWRTSKTRGQVGHSYS